MQNISNKRLAQYYQSIGKCKMLNSTLKNFGLICLLGYLFIGLFPSQAKAAFPSSDNYQLQEYTFGAGGTKESTSESFGLFGTAGQLEFGRLSSANFKIGSGLEYVIMASMSAAPTFTNPGQNYDRLKFVINPSTNPSDHEYALQISTDSNFASGIGYIKSDNTIGATLTDADFQAYSAWGGTSGEYVTGLEQDTTYYLRVKTRQGDFTETGYGPADSATTDVPFLEFDVNNDAITFNNLNSGNSYTDDSKTTILTTSTNAQYGYIINAHATGTLTASGIGTINDYASDNSAPTTWTGLGFGYSTNDNNLAGGTADRFTNGGPKYAGFTTDIDGDPVADHPGPLTNAITDEDFTISYKVVTDQTKKAGTYSTTILYVVVPSY